MGFEEHDFYCLACGKKGLPCQRKKGFQHEKHHRKKLFCFYCNKEVNHIECRNYEEVEEFKTNFENGVYKDEAEESIVFNGGNTGVWENNLYKKRNGKRKGKYSSCIS